MGFLIIGVVMGPHVLGLAFALSSTARVLQLLRERSQIAATVAQEIAHVAVENDTALVENARKRSRPVHFSDASSREVLTGLGAANAAAIVVTINDADAVERIVTEARRAWPHIPIYARARDADHARRLHAKGAALASPDTIEAALQLGEALLNGIGVPDEIARRLIQDRRDVELAKAIYRAPG